MIFQYFGDHAKPFSWYPIWRLQIPHIKNVMYTLKHQYKSMHEIRLSENKYTLDLCKALVVCLLHILSYKMFKLKNQYDMLKINNKEVTVADTGSLRPWFYPSICLPPHSVDEVLVFLLWAFQNLARSTYEIFIPLPLLTTWKNLLSPK